jgi:hypothetical protein
MAKHRILTTDKDIEKARADSAALPAEPRVTGVHLAKVEDETLFVLAMDDGSRNYIPKSKLERLGDAPDDAASRFEISEDGLAVYWPDLDLDLYVPALLRGVYGTEKWMASLGQRGGRVRSEAKSDAARENGRKGGRPCNVMPPNQLRTHEPMTEQLVVPALGLRTHYRTRTPRLQYGSLLHRRANFAVLFGMDELTSPRALPRIA